jgi:hypothetical protein
MLPALSLALALAGQHHDPVSTVYSGRAHAVRVTVPRQEAEPTIDGRLDEPVWAAAARLTDFTQYSPIDGVPADDSTDVLVWYSPSAIYFGIRAYERHGAVHATLADRDKIFSDDNVQIFLGTFNDGRQATFFAVNPLGVQADGVLVESGKSSGVAQTREAPDLSPDYVFQSKGRLTGSGYEVEVRIPFKSLRYGPGREHTWSLNVLRAVQHSGYEDTWAPARRASASFLGQSGALTGLADLHRGLVMDLTPEVTSKVTGLPAAPGWNYDVGNPQVGGTVRWGVTNNLTLNGTAKPDFSQVESDAGQLAFDPRQALFFDEKRPFFLDGIEQFNTPNNLVYTRRIVQPVAAVKLTGKAFGTNLGVLSAVDDPSGSATGTDHPVYNVLRVLRDVGRRSRIGLLYTDKIDGDGWNRLADVDGRILFGGAYAAQFQLAGSRTHDGDGTRTAPLWSARFDNNARTFGWRSSFAGVGDAFQAGAGFIGRAGVVNVDLDPRVTLYGRRGSAIERFTGDIELLGTWQYQHFVHGRGIQDRKIHFNAGGQLRGGWNVSTGLFIESFGYDSTLYADYYLVRPNALGGADTVRFVGQPRIPNFEGIVQISTPQFAKFDASGFVLYGHDENFYEWASSRLVLFNAALNWRPTDKLRVGLSYNWQLVMRRTDGTTVGQGRIPRLKIEYQLARPLFVRVVGQYVATEQDSLRDASRTEAPIVLRDPTTGAFSRAAAVRSNTMRADVLLAYQPTPGTVLFAGYGSTLDEPRAFRFADLTRTADDFFLKLSYLFRL